VTSSCSNKKQDGPAELQATLAWYHLSAHQTIPVESLIMYAADDMGGGIAW